MTTKQLLVGAFFLVAAILFAFVGFDIVDSTEFELTNLGLLSLTLGLALNYLWSGGNP